MSRVYSASALTWHGDVLRLNGREVARVVHAKWRSMWRVKIGGQLSDMANRARVKDAAVSLSLTILNRKQGTEETPSEGPPVSAIRLEAVAP